MIEKREREREVDGTSRETASTHTHTRTYTYTSEMVAYGLIGAFEIGAFETRNRNVQVSPRAEGISVDRERNRAWGTITWELRHCSYLFRLVYTMPVSHDYCSKVLAILKNSDLRN
jgi:hypothetical protein